MRKKLKFVLVDKNKKRKREIWIISTRFFGFSKRSLHKRIGINRSYLFLRYQFHAPPPYPYYDFNTDANRRRITWYNNELRGLRMHDNIILY